MPRDPTREKLAEEFLELSDRPGEYRHAFLVIRTFLNWCVSVGYLERSPLEGLRLTVAPRPRTRVLSADEIRAVWAHDDLPLTDVVKLMILTGQRRSELTAIKAEWVTDNFVHLPASVTKNKRPHSFPIGPLAKALFERVPVVQPEGFASYRLSSEWKLTTLCPCWPVSIRFPSRSLPAGRITERYIFDAF